MRIVIRVQTSDKENKRRHRFIVLLSIYFGLIILAKTSSSQAAIGVFVYIYTIGEYIWKTYTYWKMNQPPNPQAHPSYPQHRAAYYYPAPPGHVRHEFHMEQPYYAGGYSNRPVVYIYSDEYQRRQEAETGLFALMCATLFCCCLLPPVPHCY